MNIFVLADDPIIAAQHQCDKHVVKMVLETAQMLCTVASRYVDDVPYRPTHKNHPCTLWAGTSRANWEWTIQHGLALCAEYTFRYGKTHKSEVIIKWCSNLNLKFDQEQLTPYAQAMPDQYKCSDAVKAYRAYYIGEKQRFAKWQKQRLNPSWWNNYGPVAQE